MRLARPVFVGTYPPEECGLATFTKDSADAVDAAACQRVSSVIAIQRLRNLSKAESRVVRIIDANGEHAFREAAHYVNRGPHDVVSLQHEFGLYPGRWGEGIMQFVENCTKPIVTTFHTLMTQPEALPHRLIRQLAYRSDALIVMTKAAANILRTTYGITDRRIHVIPHGVPVVPFERSRQYRSTLGLGSRNVICTFGLINSGKGLELMIHAMQRIIQVCPDAVYHIVGVTHPQVKRNEGERYRTGLMQLANDLGLRDHVRFVDRYLSLEDLIKYLQSCDVFVTPYPGKDQIASGTMAYAMAAVGAVVSTPYLYAKEVLADGRGLLVPFSQSESLAAAVLQLLTDETLHFEIRRRAYAYAQQMFWPHVGQAYFDLFQQVSVNATSPGTPVSRKEVTHSNDRALSNVVKR